MNVAKISVNSFNTEGSHVYDKYIFCENFKEVKELLSLSNTEYHYGKGCDVLDKNDEILFHTDDFNELENDITNNGSYGVSKSSLKKQITLKKLVALHQENNQ